MNTVGEVIEHYGTRGMKWGVRKNSSGGSNVNLQRVGTPPLHISEDHARARQLKMTPIHALSNSEVKALNERVRLEQEYARLNPTATQRGKAMTRQFLNDVGLVIKVATLATNKDTQQAIENGKRMLGMVPKVNVPSTTTPAPSNSSTSTKPFAGKFGGSKKNAAPPSSFAKPIIRYGTQPKLRGGKRTWP